MFTVTVCTCTKMYDYHYNTWKQNIVHLVHHIVQLLHEVTIITKERISFRCNHGKSERNHWIPNRSSFWGGLPMTTVLKDEYTMNGIIDKGKSPKREGLQRKEKCPREWHPLGWSWQEGTLVRKEWKSHSQFLQIAVVSYVRCFVTWRFWGIFYFIKFLGFIKNIHEYNFHLWPDHVLNWSSVLTCLLYTSRCV